MAPCDASPQDCQDLLEVSPAQSVKLESYIRQLETQGITRVKMFIVITMAYLIFWGPLFVVTLANYSDDWKAAKQSMAHEVYITPLLPSLPASPF